MITIVTGTDTGVGKTITTAALAARGGPSTIAVKPVQTGVGPDTPDIEVIARLAGCETAEFTRLADPLAPDTAARLRGVPIPPISTYAAEIRALTEDHDTVIVEGAGGLLVRLDTEGGTLLDLAADLARTHPIDVRLVTHLGLGTLNHTELTLAALRGRGLEASGLIIGSAPADPDLAQRLNATELPRLTGVPITASIPAGAGSLPPQRFRAQEWLSSAERVRQ